jgi:beta-galactosidase
LGVKRGAALRPVLRRLTPGGARAADDGHGRLLINLNAGWGFHRVESDDRDLEPTQLVGSEGAADGLVWDRVNLPHSVRLEPLNASGGRNFQGVCWYRRTLHLRPEWRDRIVHLHFEGAMQQSDVWLNGRQVAAHDCGYTPFTIDVTPFLNFTLGASNQLLLRLDNRDNAELPPGKPQAQLDFCYFGGLYRNVRAVVMNRLHISDPLLSNQVAGGGIFVTFPSVADDRATLRV